MYLSGDNFRGEQSEIGVSVRQFGPKERLCCHLLHGQGRVRHQQRRLPARVQEHHRGLLLLLPPGTELLCEKIRPEMKMKRYNKIDFQH